MAALQDPRPASTMIAEIVAQHADNAAFLWTLRDTATDQPHYTLSELAALEERIEAHLDGLRVAGEGGFAIASAQLGEYRGPGELFAVATLALERRDDAEIEQVLQFAKSDPGSCRGLFGALGWVSPESLRGRAAAWLEDRSAFGRLVGVVACSVHRADPGSRMERLLLDNDELVRARALRLAGELGRVDLAPRIRRALNDPQEDCRFWAAWSAGLLGERAAAIPVLKACAGSERSLRRGGLDLLLRLVDRQSAVDWFRELDEDLANTRLLVMAVGALGDAAGIPWLIDKMGSPALARVAGDSLSLITGIDLVTEHLDGPAPEGFTAGPTDDPADESVASDPDEYFPWPDPKQVQAWWDKAGVRFRHGEQQPLWGVERCYETLRRGRQSHRRVAAYALGILRVGQPLWNWRARSAVQLSRLGTSTQL